MLKIKEIYSVKNGTKCLLPLVNGTISAGFPSPAEDHIEQALDLNELLIQHPAATFFVKVEGQSMIDAGIHSGDILVVDKAIVAQHNKVVVAVVNGEFTVKRIHLKGENILLVPENKTFHPIEIGREMDFQIWGVVTYVIHKV
jgi:DNA polymerase V